MLTHTDSSSAPPAPPLTPSCSTGALIYGFLSHLTVY